MKMGHGICTNALFIILLKWEVQQVRMPLCDIIKMRNGICRNYRFVTLLNEREYVWTLKIWYY